MPSSANAQPSEVVRHRGVSARDLAIEARRVRPVVMDAIDQARSQRSDDVRLQDMEHARSRC